MYVQSASAVGSGSSLIVGAGGTFIFDPTVGASGALANVSQSLSLRPAPQVEVVPEPATLALLGVAGIVAAFVAWRRRRNTPSGT